MPDATAATGLLTEWNVAGGVQGVGGNASWRLTLPSESREGYGRGTTLQVCKMRQAVRYDELMMWIFSNHSASLLMRSFTLLAFFPGH